MHRRMRMYCVDMHRRLRTTSGHASRADLNGEFVLIADRPPRSTDAQNFFLPAAGTRLTSKSRAAQFDSLTKRGYNPPSKCARSLSIPACPTPGAATEQISRAGECTLMINDWESRSDSPMMPEGARRIAHWVKITIPRVTRAGWLGGGRAGSSQRAPSAKASDLGASPCGRRPQRVWLCQPSKELVSIASRGGDAGGTRSQKLPWDATR